MRPKRLRFPSIKRIQKVGILIMGISALLLLVQPLLRWTANYYLTNKAHLPVRVGRLFVNPATSRVSLGFKGARPAQILLLDLGMIRLDWWTLVRKRLRVGQVSIENADFSVKRDARGRLFVGEIELPEGEAPAKSAAPAQTPESSTWGIGTGPIEISTVSVHYQDPLLKMDLTVRHLTVEPIESWHADRESRFEADLVFQGAPLHLSGTVRPFSNPLRIRGKIELEKLPLDWLTLALSTAGISSLQGGLSAAIDYDVRIDSTTKAYQAETSGRLSISSMTVRGSAIAVSQAGFSGDLGWNGLRVEGSSQGLTSIQFDELSIGPGARVDMRESNFHPAFRYVIAPLALKVGPGKLIDAHPPIPFTLKLKSPSGGSISAEGKTIPTASPPEGMLKLKIDDLNLTAFSPFVEHKTSYRLASGQFTLSTDAKIERGMLASNTKFDAKSLYVNKLRSEDRDATMESIGLPIGLGLALLRDADDHIRLEVPVDGALTDPKVPVRRLVWIFIQKAIAAAIRNAAMAFFPGGGQMGFKPVLFAPNVSALSPEVQTYLTELSKNMAKHPQVSVSIQSFITPEDYFALAKKKPATGPAPFDWNKLPSSVHSRLQALGAARAQMIQEFVAQSGGVNSTRLRVAAAQEETSSSAIPRGELSLQ